MSKISLNFLDLSSKPAVSAVGLMEYRPKQAARRAVAVALTSVASVSMRRCLIGVRSCKHPATVVKLDHVLRPLVQVGHDDGAQCVAPQPPVRSSV